MLTSVLIGCGLVVLCTIIHATCMMAGLRWIRFAFGRRWGHRSGPARASVVATLALIMFFAAILESCVWAVTYLLLGVITEFEQAIYFSTVTYTTLGYGDVVLAGDWRLLSAFEAAIGIMMFGWTTALIFAAVHRVYFGIGDERTDQADEAEWQTSSARGAGR